MNLDTSLKYKIISILYSRIEDSMGFCCDNCNRAISNIAKIEDNNGNFYHVGLDCAKTLSNGGKNIDYLDLMYAEYAFEEGKSLRVKIQKFNKKYPESKPYIYTNKSEDIFLCNDLPGFGMAKIVYPNISLEYIKDLIN